MVSFLIISGLGMMAPNIVKDFEKFGIDTAKMGKIVGLATWCQVIFVIPLSMFLSKINPKFSVSLTLFFAIIGFAVIGLAQQVPMLYAGCILFAVFANLVPTMLVGVKVRGVPPHHMAQINGIENFASVIGMIVAFLIIPVLIAVFGTWRSVFYIVVTIMMICLIFYLILYGNGNRITFDQAEGTTDAGGPGENMLAALKETISNKVVWLTGIAYPGTTVIWYATLLFWPTYAVEERGIDLSQAGIVLAMIPVFSAIGALVSPMLAKKIGYDKPLICSWGFILPVLYYMMTVTTNLPLLILFAALAGFGAYCFVPLVFTNMYKIGLSKPAITIAVGIIMTFVTIGIALAGSAVGSLIEAFGGIEKALRIACLTPFWFGILTLFLPELGHKKTQQLEIKA